MSYDPPTDGARRCMIYRHVRRLDDACDGCNKSTTFCHANTALNRERCCESCTH